MADLFVNKLQKKNVAILYISTDWGNSNHQFLVENLNKLGATIVYDESYSPGQNIDFQSPLTAMAAAKPDLYYFGAEYNDAAMIVKQAREMGIKETISCSGLEYANEFLTLGGDAIEGVYLNTLFFPDSPDPKDKAFIEAFNTEYKKLPTINASESYEAAKVLLEAIRIGGTDKAKVRDALENMKDFVAFNRPVTFSKTNHNSFNSHYIILQVKDGKFVPVT
jgi:branched-chain amino acid transport system substrate-binding protein